MIAKAILPQLNIRNRCTNLAWRWRSLPGHTSQIPVVFAEETAKTSSPFEIFISRDGAYVHIEMKIVY